MNQITSHGELANVLAERAGILREVIATLLDECLALQAAYATFQAHLRATPEEFADTYSETLVFIMFTSLLHGTGEFSLEDAVREGGESTPLLHDLYSPLLDPGLDENVAWGVGHIAEVFVNVDLPSLVNNLGAGEGDNTIGKVSYSDGAVWINDHQYFDDVPELVWSFYVGGYQPAQKWLKDRKDTALTPEDILHYQRIIKVLSETDRIMEGIKMSFNAASTPE